MNRRHFLKGLAASAAAATVAIKTERELHRQIYDRPVVQTEGFGLIQAKPEGGRMLYEAPSVPRYIFKQDTDVGMYCPSKDTLTLVAGGLRA